MRPAQARLAVHALRSAALSSRTTKRPAPRRPAGPNRITSCRAHVEQGPTTALWGTYTRTQIVRTRARLESFAIHASFAAQTFACGPGARSELRRRLSAPGSPYGKRNWDTPARRGAQVASLLGRAWHSGRRHGARSNGRVPNANTAPWVHSTILDSNQRAPYSDLSSNHAGTVQASRSFSKSDNSTTTVATTRSETTGSRPTLRGLRNEWAEGARASEVGDEGTRARETTSSTVFAADSVEGRGYVSGTTKHATTCWQILRTPSASRHGGATTEKRSRRDVCSKPRTITHRRGDGATHPAARSPCSTAPTDASRHPRRTITTWRCASGWQRRSAQ